MAAHPLRPLHGSSCQALLVEVVLIKRCRSVVAYKTTVMPIHSMTSISEGGKLSLYDSVDEEVLRSYHEFSLANLIFYAMKESACSEQSQRMTAMDGATKNAGMFSCLVLITLLQSALMLLVAVSICLVISSATTIPVSLLFETGLMCSDC